MKSDYYDAVVVGSGFGGSLTAYILAKAGLQTVLVERGGWAQRDELDWNQREILLKQRYRSKAPLLVKQYGAVDYEPLFSNEVVGGLSVFYGGASLRLRKTDFAAWPIDYEELEPFYSQAEQLLMVHGESGADLDGPPRSQPYPKPSPLLSPPAERIYKAAKRLGYAPFKIPLAINFTDPGRRLCIKCNTCDGFPCRIEAKNDLTVTVLKRAQEFGLEIVAGAIVAELQADRGKVDRVVFVGKESKERFSVGAGIVLVGAGALYSPGLLQRSGLGSDHRFFGRCLMRHCNAVASYLFPRATNPDNLFHKQLCFTDFYEDLRPAHGTAVGVIQDIYTPSPDVLYHYAPSGLKRLASLASRRIQNLLCIAEKEVFVVSSVFDQMLAAMERAGAVRLNEQEIRRLTESAMTMVGEDDHRHFAPSKEFLGQDATKLADAAGKRIPATVELLFGETDEADDCFFYSSRIDIAWIAWT